ncbi:hypothetical protein HOI18_00765 [Candidatus Uhrbacteria bacterium]|jgi:hypothetical protein|nr:hypothetical protein [Candidatus Uhrbacteria bacterium]
MKKRTFEFITESLGWIGVLAILLGYALISFQIVESSSRLFHGINFVGALGILIDAAADKNWQPVVLNVVWIGLASYGIFMAVV